MSFLVNSYLENLRTPVQLGSSLALWLDAADASTVILNGSTVSQWNDKSGNSRHAVQATAANQPTYTVSGLNGKPVLTFNGTSTFLNAPNGVLIGQNWTFFAVATMESAAQLHARLVSARRSMASGGNGSDYNDAASWVVLNRYAANNRILSENVAGPIDISLNTPYIIRVTRNRGANAIALNGGTPVTSAVILQDLNTTDGIRIGRSLNSNYEANEHWAGIAGEIVFAQNLSTTDQQRLEGYLAHKWGLASNLPSDHPYKTSPPTV